MKRCFNFLYPGIILPVLIFWTEKKKKHVTVQVRKKKGLFQSQYAFQF